MHSKETLLQRLKDGKKTKYVHFWGHQSEPMGLTSSCFSQWWDQHPFTVDGIEYKTAEHWMMVQKAKLFGDEDIVPKMIAATKPGKAKSLGRKVSNFDDAKWCANRSQIVAEGNYHKFSQHEDLKTYILQTGDKILVEASPTDTIWGIGMGKTNEFAKQPAKWRGLNLLGFALMDARDRIRAEEP